VEHLRVIAGEAKGQRIISQKRLGARPTTQRVRSSLFTILESSGIEGKHVIDLYAGIGTLGIEALSRGAIWADFVDGSHKRCALLRRSLTALGFSERSKVHCMKVERAIMSLGKAYDIVLMDPPYTIGPVHHIMEKVGALAKKGALVATGHSKHHKLEPKYDGLELIRERKYGDTVCSIYREGGEPW
jgi:16S rRNA (guanine966-N2)-methyltransferase